MRELAGKTAFVTGGARRDWVGARRAFAQAGMRVMLADIEADVLHAAVNSLREISPDNWRWVIDVNLMGVLHGIKSFLPHIRAHGEGGHIVNTARWRGCMPGWA